MDDNSARKAAKNEALARSLNEGLARGEEKWPSDRPTFVCECSNLSCVDEIEISLEDYRSIHAHPHRFTLRPGHDIAEIETINDERDGFNVVEKIGPGREVLEPPG